MKKVLPLIIALPLFLLAVSNCKSPSDSITGSGDSSAVYPAYLKGYIVESSTGNAIANAVVRAYYNNTEQLGAITDNSGYYYLNLELQKEMDVLVVVSAGGYSNDTTTVSAILNQTITVPTFKLKQEQGSGGSQSGAPASVYLLSQSVESISVKEAGGIETAQIVFEILDSNGVAIDLEEAVTVNFNFGNHPNGGEFLFPSSVVSNALGRASVTLNSGTKAGVVQIEASFSQSGNTIKSQPALIAIHGGLPDDTHFSIATAKLNIPAVIFQEYTNLITAFVGDKYANPVKEGTSVYFTSEGGIIGGSVLTNVSGIGSVNFITASPVVVSHPNYGAGFFTITASTADENQNQITDDLIELFSFYPILNVSPTSFAIPNGGSKTFTFTLMDLNGNPMSEGQSISVTAEGGTPTVSGDANVKMPDTQSKAWTTFSFVLSDSDLDKDKTETVTVTILTEGANGSDKVSFSGTMN